LAVAGSDQIFGTYTDPLEKGGNYSGYSNPAVDALLDELEVTSDATKQTEIMTEIEKTLISDAYGTMIFQFPALTVASAKVSGVKPGPLSPGYFWNFWEWAPVTE
jgi:peptide/nickel transport system substrate-binding protein